MKLNELVTPDSVECVTGIASKKRTLEHLAELLAKQSGSEHALEIFQQLTEREKLGSTSLGHGVALPHTRTDLCDKAYGAFIKLSEGIDFDSPDRQPTDLLFALMVPSHYTDEHLKILAGLAALFNDKTFCDNLRNANSNAELHSILTGWQINSQAS